MNKNNLFLNWLSIELEDKTLAETLRLINAELGTTYQSNWPSKMKKTGYKIESIPKPVRQYMMRIVLPRLIDKGYTKKQLEKLVDGLT